MFSYYLGLALSSLRRSPVLTLLMIFTLGFGVAASMTTYAVFRAVSGDPIPWKSAKLFVPRIDVWGPQSHEDGDEPADGITYADARALLHDHRALRQSAVYAISLSVIPERHDQHPFGAFGHAVSAEFFPMLEVPFLYGSGWSAQDDADAAAVVVISDTLNLRLFGGADSVGRTLRLGDKVYRVVGVLDGWHPQPNFYGIVSHSSAFGRPGELFIPFDRAIAMQLEPQGNTNCNSEPSGGFDSLLHSDCIWMTAVVELDDAASVDVYRRYLDAYAASQQQAGRFRWPPNNRLRDIPSFLQYEQVVPSDTRVSLMVAVGLLLVCLVNTVGLLLAKFMRRAGEIGVRRALGASRRAIYAQFLVEAGAIGVAGGLAGLLLTALGMQGIGLVMPRDIATLARLDLPLLGLTLAVALAASLVAGVYPTYRAARVQPAWQIKAQ